MYNKASFISLRMETKPAHLSAVNLLAHLKTYQHHLHVGQIAR